MKYFKKIEGKRVYLSPMHLEDTAIYTKWLNDFAVTDGQGGSARVISLVAEKTWIEGMLQSGAQQFAIIRKDDHTLLGNCGFENIDHIHQSATVGLFIGEAENRNQGYGAEVLSLLVSYGFSYLNIHNIMLQVFAFNEAAISCYKKVGFKEIGRRREAVYMHGRKYDTIYMDIVKGDREVADSYTDIEYEKS